jgi:hypothetical protein
VPISTLPSFEETSVTTASMTVILSIILASSASAFMSMTLSTAPSSGFITAPSA